jgi:D-alanyl-D-alanine carboxypeptidase
MGYLRYALGPLRPAPKEAPGWLFAAGELAMTAEDLGRWDASITHQSILKPASYRAFETDTLLKNGLATGYGLGVQVETAADHRSLIHTGEVSGFTAANIVFPDDGAAIAVLTNEDAASAASQIAFAVAPSLVTVTDPRAPAKLEQAKRIFEGLQHGTIDRSLFTDNANSYFTPEALQDFAMSLGPLGIPDSFVQGSQVERGGMIERNYRVRIGTKALRVWTYELPDGKLEQFQVAAG